MSKSHGRAKRLRSVAGWPVACAIAMLLLVQVLGCNGSDIQQKQDCYRADWKRIMTAFDSRVISDDMKASKLVEQDDISGLIKLIDERIGNVDGVILEILDLYPPDDLQDLHAVTLYYLVSLREQLKTQNDLNEAVISGKPTQDLKAISDDAAAKAQAIAGELGIEIQKAGIKMGEKEDAEKKDEKSDEGGETREETQ